MMKPRHRSSYTCIRRGLTVGKQRLCRVRPSSFSFSGTARARGYVPPYSSTPGLAPGTAEQLLSHWLTAVLEPHSRDTVAALRYNPTGAVRLSVSLSRLLRASPAPRAPARPTSEGSEFPSARLTSGRSRTAKVTRVRFLVREAVKGACLHQSSAELRDTIVTRRRRISGRWLRPLAATWGFLFKRAVATVV